ncbi:cap-specific mRNA (nucleoside-2'-O-)-methyltransferase 2-like [Clytia hemisphaerica]|uniref:cap-specific mRNA (nucleoside-2'-O-)-methyltransferase 2-like n=1 Tax=Clytia hemisphaerica TaxID=252671 RepID=UPI0034D68EE0
MSNNNRELYKEFDNQWFISNSKIYHVSCPKESDDFIGDEEAFFASLEIEKTDLNAVKSLLNSVDIASWHRHTSNMHKFSSVPYKLRTQLKVELPTQAWAKFYSILGTFEIIPKECMENRYLKSFHLCEAPGAFIASLNHFIQNRFGYNFKLDWCSTTLNPYYEGNDLGHMIPDDRFMINTLDRWDFCPDLTGNIKNPNNFKYFVDKMGQQKINLITADGSIDCSNDPGEQEMSVASLFLWEIITALSILAENGSFVLKMFTCFQKYTIVFMYLLASVFEEVTFFKPGPSKPGNSEVYIIATKFQPEVCHHMKLYEDLKEAAFSNSTPQAIGELVDFSQLSKPFLDSIREYIEESCSLQKETIQNNRMTFEKVNHTDQQRLNKLKGYFSRRFIEDFSIEPTEHYISPMFAMLSSQGQYKNQKQSMNFREGSLNQRMKTKNNNTIGDHSETDHNKNITKHSTSKQFNAFQWDSADMTEHHLMPDLFQFKDLDNVTPTIGQTLPGIYSSSVCAPGPMEIYRKLQDLEHTNLEQKLLNFFETFHEKFNVTNNVTLVSNNESFVEPVMTACHDSQLVSKKFSTSDRLDNIHTPCIIDLGSLGTDKKTKKEIIDYLMQNIDAIQRCSLVAFHFDGLLLSNFWLGFFYLMGRLFDSITYYCDSNPKGDLFMVFEHTPESSNKDTANVDQFVRYLKRVESLLSSLEDNKDVLHVMDIKILMESHYRNYIKQSNEAFIKNFNHVSKN